MLVVEPRPHGFAAFAVVDDAQLGVLTNCLLNAACRSFA